jgi:DNA polymerase-4
VAARLRQHGLAGRTVTLKVRFGDFTTVTRSATLDRAVDSAVDISRPADALLDAIDPSPGVRLLGVGVSGLADGRTRQLSFDDAGGPDWSAADRAVDAIRARFGDRAVGPATIAGPAGLRPKEPGAQQWGPDADQAD